MSPPYSDRHFRHVDDGGGGRRSNLALSCCAAVTFLILVAAALAAVFFVFFRPRDPQIEVSSIRFPNYSASSTTGTVSFTFAQLASVRNPNRDAFSHYDSTLQLVYAGSQVGFMFIPAGEIGGGRTQYMAASFEVDSFPAAGGAGVGNGVATIEVESRTMMKGRVRVLRFLTHNVEATARCQVGVSAADGTVLGFRC